MALLYIHNTAAQDVLTHGVNWFATSFTTDTRTAVIQSFTHLLTRVGNPAGNAVISLRATSGNDPTGSDLTSVTRAVNTIGTGQQNETFTLATPYIIQPFTKYAIVFRLSAGDGSNYVAWYRSTSDTFTGGNWSTSTNSGSSWTATSFDGDFRVDGYYLSGSTAYFM